MKPAFRRGRRRSRRPPRLLLRCGASMKQRSQRTIEKGAVVSGVGFLTGADITLRFLPAAAGHGVAFLRIDKLCAPPIPALVSYTIPRSRRTAIARCGIVVEMVEHVL